MAHISALIVLPSKHLYFFGFTAQCRINSTSWRHWAETELVLATGNISKLRAVIQQPLKNHLKSTEIESWHILTCICFHDFEVNCRHKSFRVLSFVLIRKVFVIFGYQLEAESGRQVEWGSEGLGFIGSVIIYMEIFTYIKLLICYLNIFFFILKQRTWHIYGNLLVVAFFLHSSKVPSRTADIYLHDNTPEKKSCWLPA